MFFVRFACVLSSSHDGSRLSSLRALSLLLLLVCGFVASCRGLPPRIKFHSLLGGVSGTSCVGRCRVGFVGAVVVPPSCVFFVVCSCLFVVFPASCCWVPSVILGPVTIWSQVAMPGFVFGLFSCLEQYFPSGF